ncbi:hypothetical protein IAT38_008331 [Cryptococcus sp. DSM 104549]
MAVPIPPSNDFGPPDPSAPEPEPSKHATSAAPLKVIIPIAVGILILIVVTVGLWQWVARYKHNEIVARNRAAALPAPVTQRGWPRPPNPGPNGSGGSGGTNNPQRPLLQVPSLVLNNGSSYCVIDHSNGSPVGLGPSAAGGSGTASGSVGGVANRRNPDRSDYHSIELQSQSSPSKQASSSTRPLSDSSTLTSSSRPLGPVQEVEEDARGSSEEGAGEPEEAEVTIMDREEFRINDNDDSPPDSPVIKDRRASVTASSDAGTRFVTPSSTFTSLKDHANGSSSARSSTQQQPPRTPKPRISSDRTPIPSTPRTPRTPSTPRNTYPPTFHPSYGTTTPGPGGSWHIGLSTPFMRSIKSTSSLPYLENGPADGLPLQPPQRSFAGEQMQGGSGGQGKGQGGGMGSMESHSSLAYMARVPSPPKTAGRKSLFN